MPDGAAYFKRLGIEHMEPITGYFSITEQPDTVTPVAPHEAYLAAATELMRGAWWLADAPPSDSAAALALLSGQILECSLKAFLSKVGVTENELKNVLRHNLSALWERAKTEGLPISAILPEWAATLNSLHDKPHYLRYPMGLHGWVLPKAQQMTSELRNLLEMVRQRIG